MGYIKVLFPITVPDNDYCWDGTNVCNQFDNEGGTPYCSIFSEVMKYDETGYCPKLMKCMDLKNG